MITLAKSQAKAKVFAGLLIPYQLGKMNLKEKKAEKPKIKKLLQVIYDEALNVDTAE